MIHFFCCRIIFPRQIFLFKNFVSHLSNMSCVPTVFVKQLDQDEALKISFVYKYLDFPSQTFTFQRSKSELLGSALSRIKSKVQSSVLQGTTKKKKRKVMSNIELPSINVLLQKNSFKVPEDIENCKAWTSDSEFVINGLSYQILVNPPTVNHISLPRCILCNFFVYPKVILDYCSLDSCRFYWYRNILTNGLDELKNESLFICKAGEKWEFMSEGLIYDVQQDDVGHKLLVTCIPLCEDKKGPEEFAISFNNVTSGPDYCPFENRHSFTKDKTKTGSFRCVSYNILADLYADTDTARSELFPHCPAEFLAGDYRKALYLKEIAGYNADIVCLQEVDKHVFHDDLVPFLSTKGLNGVFITKGQQAEGLACFYRESKFRLVESHSVVLAEAIKNEPALNHLYGVLEQNEKLAERFLSRTTVLQVSLLESVHDCNKKVLVGNTHLYFHPESDNIRLLQGACCILYLENWLQKQPLMPDLIFCGDFNSCPEFGVYTLATKGFLPSECIDWKSNAEEEVVGLTLTHSLLLNSACGTPQYTNFTPGFGGCLDYIFYESSNLEVISVVPFPSHEQVIEYVALPNKIFPSDHLALVCTLQWK